MLSEERVRLMTKMQMFEDREGDRTAPMVNYYKTDYVAKELLISILSGTLAFGLLMVMIFADDLEALLIRVDFDNIAGTFRVIAGRYLIFLVIFLVITFIIYTIRYNHGRKLVKKYYQQLGALEKLYQEEDENTKPTGGDQ